MTPNHLAAPTLIVAAVACVLAVVATVALARTVWPERRVTALEAERFADAVRAAKGGPAALAAYRARPSEQ